MTTAEDVIRAAIANGVTLATAESCTGGLIGGALTSVSGSSKAFLGGVVTYSNTSKTEILSVEETLITKHGAVSKAVAAQMADNVRQRFGSDYAVSATGIAGPTGGSAEKPIGTVFIGLADRDGSRAYHYHFDGADRETVREKTVAASLRHLHDAIESQAGNIG